MKIKIVLVGVLFGFAFAQSGLVPAKEAPENISPEDYFADGKFRLLSVSSLGFININSENVFLGLSFANAQTSVKELQLKPLSGGETLRIDISKITAKEFQDQYLNFEIPTSVFAAKVNTIQSYEAALVNADGQRSLGLGVSFNFRSAKDFRENTSEKRKRELLQDVIPVVFVREIAPGHTLSIPCIEQYESYSKVEVRLKFSEIKRDFFNFYSSIELSDDVGTRYRVLSSGGSGSDDSISTEFVIEPRISASAKKLIAKITFGQASKNLPASLKNGLTLELPLKR